MPRLLPCADLAIIVSFAGETDAGERLRALDAHLSVALPGGIAELVPGLDSLLVVLDGTARLADVRRRLVTALGAVADRITWATPGAPSDPVELAVRFGGDDGPDLTELAARAGTDAPGLVALLTAMPLHVAVVGHLPGLPYLTGLPRSLDIPRRSSPRTAVPKGSVGVAAGMACVYPVRAPGGWHIVGRTDARLCDPDRDPPFLLAPGDAVRLVDAGAGHGRDPMPDDPPTAGRPSGG